MKNLYKLVCLLICIAFVSGCTPGTEVTETVMPTESEIVEETEVLETPVAEELTLTFEDPVSGMTIQYPEGWMPISNSGSIGITAMSSDWMNIAAFNLLYEDPQSLEEELTAIEEALVAGSAGFTDAAIISSEKLTVFDTEFDAFSWTGFNTMASANYSGIDAIVPYGMNMVHISVYAPSETWEQAKPTLLAITNSLLAPADDFAYIPPVATAEWLSFNSAEYGLYVSYPPEWQEPIAPWVGEGLWLNSEDWMTSVIVWVIEGTDANQALADWESTQDIFPTLTVTDGDPVSVLGAEYPTKSGDGFNSMGSAINCGVTFVPYNGKLLEILWYAGTDGDYWTNGQTIFTGILESIKGVSTLSSETYNLTVSFPSTWQEPMEPWVGQGIFLNSADWMTAVVIWVEEGTDSAQMLADWEVTQEIFPTLTVSDGDPITIMGVEYPTKVCDGMNSMGTAIKCGVTMVPHDGKMLEIVWYGGIDGGYWDDAQTVFPAILTSINIP